jgi:spore coat polysaccharide biosynthesis protein SpsF
MKIIAITQARCGSTRLPNKVLKKINGETLLSIHLSRILKSKKIDQLLVATTTEPADGAIEEVAKSMGLPYYRGSVSNVLDRYYQAAKPHHPDWVVRLTSDCPLIDAGLIDKIIDKAIELDVDYCSNTLDPTYPDGMDAEVFKYSALEKAWH